MKGAQEYPSDNAKPNFSDVERKTIFLAYSYYFFITTGTILSYNNYPFVCVDTHTCIKFETLSNSSSKSNSIFRYLPLIYSTNPYL